MPPGVPASNSTIILPGSTADILIDEVAKTLLFRNFKVGDSSPKKAHLDFIANFWVPLTIQTINRDKLPVQVITLPLFGRASATGNAQKNQELSEMRAEAIGDVFEFEFFKQATGLAKEVKKIRKDVRALGDKEARATLGFNPNTVPAKSIDDRQNDFRSVLTTFKMNHSITPEQTIILCRMIIDQQFKVAPVSRTLLGQQVDEVANRLPLFVRLGLQATIETIKNVLKQGIKMMLDKAEQFGPEFILIVKEIEFLVPEDVAFFFEFKDVRGLVKRYLFTGEQNKLDVSLLDALKFFGSIVKACRGVEGAVEKFINALKSKSAQKLGIAVEELEFLIATLKALGTTAKTIHEDFKRLTAPGGQLRRLLGDDATDELVRIVESHGQRFIIATTFQPCSFEDAVFPDIGTFAGPAVVLTTSVVFGSTETTFDFAPRKGVTLLGFQGHCQFRERRSLTLSVGKVELNRGRLTPM